MDPTAATAKTTSLGGRIGIKDLLGPEFDPERIRNGSGTDPERAAVEHRWATKTEECGDGTLI